MPLKAEEGQAFDRARVAESKRVAESIEFKSATTPAVRQTDQPHPLHREPRLDGTDGGIFLPSTRRSRRSPDRESPYCNFFQLRQQFRDQAAIAEHGTAEHRLFRVFADDRLWLGDLDARQQGGFLVQIIGRSRRPVQ